MMEHVYDQIHGTEGALSFLTHTRVQKREGQPLIHYTAGPHGDADLRPRLNALTRQLGRWLQDRTLQRTSQSGGVNFYHGDGFTLALRPMTRQPERQAPHHFSVILPSAAALQSPFSELLRKKPKPKAPTRSNLPVPAPPQAKRSKRSGERVRKALDEST